MLSRVWITGGLIASLASCSLVLDFSNTGDDGDPRCTELEPNESTAAAAAVGPGVYELALCGEDIDVFRVAVAGTEDLVVTTTSSADLEIELALLEGEAVIDTSDAPGASEVIERSGAMGNRLAAGEYHLRVQGPAGVEGEYDLEIVLTAASLDAGVDAPVDAL